MRNLGGCPNFEMAAHTPPPTADEAREWQRLAGNIDLWHDAASESLKSMDSASGTKISDASLLESMRNEQQLERTSVSYLLAQTGAPPAGAHPPISMTDGMEKALRAEIADHFTMFRLDAEVFTGKNVRNIIRGLRREDLSTQDRCGINLLDVHDGAVCFQNFMEMPVDANAGVVIAAASALPALLRVAEALDSAGTDKGEIERVERMYGVSAAADRVAIRAYTGSDGPGPKLVMDPNLAWAAGREAMYRAFHVVQARLNPTAAPPKEGPDLVLAYNLGGFASLVGASVGARYGTLASENRPASESQDRDPTLVRCVIDMPSLPGSLSLLETKFRRTLTRFVEQIPHVQVFVRSNPMSPPPSLLQSLRCAVLMNASRGAMASRDAVALREQENMHMFTNWQGIAYTQYRAHTIRGITADLIPNQPPEDARMCTAIGAIHRAVIADEKLSEDPVLMANLVAFLQPELTVRWDGILSLAEQAVKSAATNSTDPESIARMHGEVEYIFAKHIEPQTVLNSYPGI
jgi:hypothetical protein